MTDISGILSLFVNLVPGRYGEWLSQPDVGLLCPDGTLGGPSGEGCRIVQWTAPYELRELTVSWLRNISGAPPEDVVQATFHFINLTSGVPDATWVDADFTTVESAFDTWWGTGLKPYYRPEYVLSEYVWRKDGPAFKPFGTANRPTVRRVARSVPGTNSTSTQSLPPQISVNCTERTSAQYTVEDVEGVGDQLRNRWGRFYMPAPAVEVAVSGRPGSSFTTALATRTKAVYDATKAADIIAVMYSPTTGSAWSVDAVAVDDVFDVIRSRRLRNVTARQVGTIA